MRWQVVARRVVAVLALLAVGLLTMVGPTAATSGSAPHPVPATDAWFVIQDDSVPTPVVAMPRLTG